MAYNILIVDDSLLVREMVAKTLHISGLPLGQVHKCANGEEALAVLRKNWIDVVLADVNMPCMDGVAMVQEMAHEGMLKATPVIIVSTERSAARLDALRKAGVRAFITKPFTPEQINQVVTETLKGGRHA